MLNSILSDGEIRRLIEEGVLEVGDRSKVDSSLQPATYDLSVGERMWRMAENFLPKPGQSVLDMIHRFNGREIDLRGGADLERGQVYIVEMAESVNLDDTLALKANTKSSSGRLNLQTRLISDGNAECDLITGPFSGKMYTQLVSSSFFQFLATGTSLNQTGFFRGEPRVSDDELYSRSLERPLLYGSTGEPLSGRKFLRNGLVLTLDLESDIVGFRAKTGHKVVDLQKVGYHEVDDFWEIIRRPKDGTLRLDVGKFYILSTREGVSLPSVYAGELSFVDPRASRSPVHEAGFIDPWFGFSTPGGNNLTLEVNPSRTDNYVNGQRVGVLAVERVSGIPSRLYGAPGLGSNYGVQRGPKLSKHFKVA